MIANPEGSLEEKLLWMRKRQENLRLMAQRKRAQIARQSNPKNRVTEERKRA